MTDETTQTTDNQASTTTEATAAPTATETTQTTPPANPAVSETTEGNEQPKPARSPWYQTRIDQLTAARRAAEAEVVRLRAQLGQPAASAPAPAANAPAAAPGYTQQPANQGYQPAPALDEAEVQRRAAAIVQEQQFNQACNNLANKGKETYPDFDASIANFNMLGGLGQHMGMLQAVTALDNGHEVLYHLGKDLDQAMQVANLPPVQQGMAIAKLASQLRQGKAPTISGAPAPINPIGGQSASNTPAPDSNGEFKSQEDFRRFRQAQREAKRNRR